MKFKVYRTKNKQWRWRLVARNGKIVANAGESYKRVADCMDALALVVGTSHRTPIFLP